MSSIKFYFARVSRCTVDPLLNLFRRNIVLFNTSISNDIIQYNNTQEYIASIASDRMVLYNCTANNIPNSNLMSILYDSVAKYNLNTLEFKTDYIVPLQTTQLYVFDIVSYYTMSYTNYISNRLNSITTTQLLNYQSSYNSFITGNNEINAIITPLSDAQIINSDLLNTKYISSQWFKTGYNSYNITQVLNYGGENTFYSLNGFFNYFRYKYSSLMPDKYTILIGTNKLNFYDQNMTCLETHYLGFKKFYVGGTFLKQSLYNTIFIDNTFYTYDTNTLKLYIYHIDSLELESKLYFALNDSINPDEVSLFIDPTYKSPYIMPKTTESTSGMTAIDTGWNFLQCNNIKLLPSVTSVEEARLQYINELRIPTKEIISGILYRYESKIILYGSSSNNDINIFSLDLNAQGNLEKIFTYFGSDILYSEFPFIYYVEAGNNFLADGSTVFYNLVKLNIDTLNYEKTNINASKYLIRKNNYLWHLYLDIDLNCFMLRRDDQVKSINISVVANIAGKIIQDFIVLNMYDLYLIVDKEVIYIDLQTLRSTKIVVSGEPIKLQLFTSSIGAVISYNNGYVQIEDIQGLKWPSAPSEWHTPLDLKRGDILKPYRLYLNILHKRLSPVFKQYDNIIMERVGGTTWEYEFTLPIKYRQLSTAAAPANIRVGIPSMNILSTVDRFNGINTTTIVSTVESSEVSSIDNQLNDDKKLELTHKINNLPCSLQKGFKIYEV